MEEEMTMRHKRTQSTTRTIKMDRRRFPVIKVWCLLVEVLVLFAMLDPGPPPRWTSTFSAQAVSVQRLQVPDLVVIDQQQQRQVSAAGQPVARTQPQDGNLASGRDLLFQTTWTQPERVANGPEAASLINQEAFQQQQQITFECLIVFDRRKDRNLIVKWHHDERNEPIYQWILELNKRTIAPQYRAFIAPITSSIANASNTTAGQQDNNNQVQLLEVGFRLIRPTKELGGKYTCSAISAQNDDSKSKKMIVYTPPKSFRFNASRTDIGALLASQRDRLIQLTQPPSGVGGVNNNNHQQLPPAYRMRGLEGAQATTISPQMYSTIDYVNVNQQRSRLQQQSTTLPNGWPAATNQRTQHQLQLTARNNNYTTTRTPQKQQLGVKLVCDIDQVFPVPEVSIYRLARLDGSHPEKLPKLDTKIERDVHSGLFHVQVTSILDDDELQLISHRYQQQQQQQQRFMMTNSAAHNQQQEPPLGDVYFECLIALTNLELSKYADNKRSITYRPGQQLASSLQSASHETGQDFSRSTLELFGARSSSPPALLAGRESALPIVQALSMALISLALQRASGVA